MRKGSPHLIGDIVKNVVEELQQTKKKDADQIFSAWPTVVGKELSRHSRPASLRRGTLLVNVDESAWLYQVNLQKETLLQRLQAKIGAKKIQKIRFRIGNTHGRK